jgi:hypothetical protein
VPGLHIDRLGFSVQLEASWFVHVASAGEPPRGPAFMSGDHPSQPRARPDRVGAAVGMDGLSASVLELVPGGHRSKLEQGAVALRVPVAELRHLIVPRDLEQVLLHPLVEPGTTEDELA